MQPGKLRRQRGITLVEVIATVAVFAVVSAIAIPSFAQVQRNARRTTVINDFIHAVMFARSEAIKRSSTVSICRSSDGATCENKAPTWNGGWIVFENLDGDQPADRDGGEPILLHHDPLSVANGGAFTSNRVAFSFRAFNQADANGTLIYCPAKGDSKDARAIIISHTGRPRAANKDASGKTLKC